MQENTQVYLILDNESTKTVVNLIVSRQNLSFPINLYKSRSRLWTLFKGHQDIGYYVYEDSDHKKNNSF